MPKYICDKCNHEYTGKFCPECGDKRTKKDKTVMTDSEIIKDLLNDTKGKVKNVKVSNKISVVFFILAFIFGTIANYHKAIGELTNSNYFVGYMVLAGSLLISGSIFYNKNKN